MLSISQDQFCKIFIEFCFFVDVLVGCLFVSTDGYTYERACIEEWLRSGRKTSPMTNAPLKNTALTPNRILKNLIQGHFSNSQNANF